MTIDKKVELLTEIMRELIAAENAQFYHQNEQRWAAVKRAKERIAELDADAEEQGR